MLVVWLCLTSAGGSYVLWPECRRSTLGSIPPSDPCRPLPFGHGADVAAAPLAGQKECVARGTFCCCSETGSPTHTDTLLLNRGHFSLAANTSHPLPAVHKHSPNHFLKKLSPWFSSSFSQSCAHTNRHCNTFVSVSRQCFILSSILVLKCFYYKKK